VGWELCVESFNSTSWPTFKERLLETSAHIVCGQELHLVGQQVGQASAWAKSRGWKSLIMEAIPGKGEAYSSGGVGVFVRSWMGLQAIDIPGLDFQRGRLIAGLVEPPGFPQIMVASVYTVSGKGLGIESLELLQQLGSIVAARESPFIIGGTFKLTPGSCRTPALLTRSGARSWPLRGGWALAGLLLGQRQLSISLLPKHLLHVA